MERLRPSGMCLHIRFLCSFYGKSNRIGLTASFSASTSCKINKIEPLKLGLRPYTEVMAYEIKFQEQSPTTHRGIGRSSFDHVWIYILKVSSEVKIVQTFQKADRPGRSQHSTHMAAIWGILRRLLPLLLRENEKLIATFIALTRSVIKRLWESGEGKHERKEISVRRMGPCMFSPVHKTLVCREIIDVECTQLTAVMFTDPFPTARTSTCKHGTHIGFQISLQNYFPFETVLELGRVGNQAYFYGGRYSN